MKHNFNSQGEYIYNNDKHLSTKLQNEEENLNTNFYNNINLFNLEKLYV